MSMVMHISSLASPFSVLFLTSPVYFVPTNLCFLIPAPFFPFSLFPLPLITLQVISTFDSVPVLLVCSVCFIDSIVDNCEFIASLSLDKERIKDSLFIFNLWHFNYDVSWCGPLCVHLVWDSLCFLDLHVISFTTLGGFSFIMFSNKFSISCSFSSPYSTPMIQILVHLRLFQRLLSLSLFFGGYFFLLLF